MQNTIDELNRRFQGASTREILEYFLHRYTDKIALASSFGAEDQVLTDLLYSLKDDADVFTLDTGRLPYETYDVMQRTNVKYGVKIAVFFPVSDDVEKLYASQGINGFYESVENRKSCCHVRKTVPLKRALAPLDVWITGLRRAQSVTRETIQVVEWDEANGLIKINPLIDWSEKEVWEHIKEHKIPYSDLHDKGYPSIGCAPCSRAVKSGEDIRSGRWWWENPEHKECGLHLKTS
ncbi:MAG: phosphoadenylyl-sulfate reductase [Campylobacterota bacterium]